MFDERMDRLDAAATLGFVSEMRSVVERAEARLLEGVAHWADLHGHLDEADPARALPGTERLVQLGGDGTPEVAEFAPAELGAVLAVSPAAAARLIGDVLDLRHRLPRLWWRVLAGEVKPWLARQAASATRYLPAAIAAAVDRRVAPYAHSLSLGRLDTLIAAAIIHADPEAAAAAAEQAERSRGVWLGPSNDHGIKDIHARTDAPDAIRLDAVIDRIADALGRFGDTEPKDVRRARALGYLTRPDDVLDLFARAAALTDGDDQAEAGAAAQPDPPTRTRATAALGRPLATLYVHLSHDAIRSGVGVARLEGEGPITVDQAKHWLGHCDVTVKPVIDLLHQTPIDGYEVPDRLRDAIHLRSPVDIFPFATNTGRNKQADHTIGYQPPDHGDPPGQTRTDNLAPMTAFHHRVKTHGHWHVTQVLDGVFVWRSPHGRHYLVDHTGTSPALRAA